MVLIYSTCGSAEEARNLSKLIIERKIAACVNTWPIESCYTWEGAVKCESEYALLIKTNESKVQDVEDLILKNHTYSTPLVAVVDVRRLNRAYKEWMTTVVG
ncbi:divalent-cation tolerance protein CutA [Patescibacteria group bacterium]|nr:divalent-cation tolerance protein CutA [Patescibacteria group bacterium]